jgi:hypothetical protein
LSQSGNISQPKHDRFNRVVNELQKELSQADPYRLAYNTDTIFDPSFPGRGQFQLSLREQELLLSFPDFIVHEKVSGKELPIIDRVLLMYYFSTADGTPISGQWISFSELPDGRFYNQAFQSYTGTELERFFQDDLERFELVAKKQAGFRYSLGTASYSFRTLPRVSLLVIFWQGDEDFPSSFKILFDASASHYLPTDGYAILGSTLTRKLIGGKQISPEVNHRKAS